MVVNPLFCLTFKPKLKVYIFALKTKMVNKMERVGWGQEMLILFVCFINLFYKHFMFLRQSQ